MATPRKLSSEEISSLVSDLMFDEDEEEVSSLSGDLPVRSYTFGQNDTTALGDFYALQMVNERFCRTARSVFLPMLRMQPRISSFPPELRSFDDYRASQDNFISITNSRIEELRGNMLMVQPPSFISLLTDAYYGGTIRNIRSQRTEFTASEIRVIEILTERLNDALALAWRDLMTVTFSITGQEENMQFAQFVDAEDMVVICSFMVQLPSADAAGFDVIYPLQTLKPIASQLRSRMQSDFVDDDQSWRGRLENAIMEIPLQVAARLCETEITLGRLMQMQDGDVSPAMVGDRLDILVEGSRLFSGEAGNSSGQSAVRITGVIGADAQRPQTKE